MTGPVSSASWYGLLNPWDASDDFYLDLIMQARSVIDVGCGTGTLLHRAREEGHVGHLHGVDPDPAMLTRARTRSDIEWTLGTAAEVLAGDCDLVTMTGHAFQTLVTDDELAKSLRAIRGALASIGDLLSRQGTPEQRPGLTGMGNRQCPTPAVLR